MHRAFFGRRAETDELARLLRASADRDQREIVVVVGPSGCGKSSLVRAGVIPALSREKGWAVLPPAFPGENPLTGIARSFAEAMAGDSAWTASRVAQRIAADGLLDVISDFLATYRGPAAARLLLVLDQFEEIMTRTSAADRRRAVDGLMPAILDGSLRVVATMRSEFWAHCWLVRNLASCPFGGLHLARSTPQMLPTVVEAPMKLAGFRISPELVSRIAADTESGESLPLLAYTLQQLTEGLPRGAELSTRAYEQNGGVRGTLVREAEAALDEATAARHRTRPGALATLLRMVTVDDGERVTRVEADYGVFTAEGRDVVDAFVRRRLLGTLADAISKTGDTKVWVGVAHEAFLREWRPLATLIDTHRAALAMRVAVEEAARKWEASGRKTSYLWHRDRLAGAMSTIGASFRRPSHSPFRNSRTAVKFFGRPVVVDGSLVDLTTEAHEFASASFKRNRRRWQSLTAAVLVVLIGALTLTGVALHQRQDAISQRKLATSQRDLAIARALVARAQELKGTDVREALKLDLAAGRLASTPDTRSSVAATLEGTPLTASVPESEDPGEIAFSPDGRTLAVTTTEHYSRASGTLQLWDVTDPHTPARAATITESQAVVAVAFSPDGRTLAVTTSPVDSSGSRGMLQLWNVTDRPRWPAPPPFSTARTLARSRSAQTAAPSPSPLAPSTAAAIAGRAAIVGCDRPPRSCPYRHHHRQPSCWRGRVQPGRPRPRRHHQPRHRRLWGRAAIVGCDRPPRSCPYRHHHRQPSCWCGRVQPRRPHPRRHHERRRSAVVGCGATATLCPHRHHHRQPSCWRGRVQPRRPHPCGALQRQRRRRRSAVVGCKQPPRAGPHRNHHRQ